jgi:hypothetical protein
MESGPRWLILGYDARELPERLAGAWPPERRERFLYYRQDVESPLSVDEAVWPSVFERRPAWTGRVQGLWEDLSRLRQAVPGAEDCWLVGFAVDLASLSERAERTLEKYLRGVTPEGRPGPHPEPHEIAQPAAIDSGWEWLGCDVSDFFSVSALSNAGLEDMGTLRREWGPRLNRHHLFDRVADARRFQALADERVSEHAPFYVMGLWRIR